ncbi:MAG: hypothetical protein ACTHU0_04885 [Kofleriaceae bacterium]
MPARSLKLVAGVVVVAFLAAYVRMIAGGQTWEDVRYHTEVAPPRLAAAEAVQSARLPAWWEGSGLGVPLAGEPSHGALYPVTWLAASPRALDLVAILHLVWAGLGIAVWARRRQVSWAPRGASDQAALVVAVLAATSGILASTALRGALPAIAHLPWIGAAAGWLADASDPRDRARAAAALGGLLGLVGLSGELAGLVAGLALALALAARRRSLGWLALAVVSGLAIAAAQWAPALARLVLDPGAGAEVHALPLARLIELIVPGSFGSPDSERAVASIAGEAPWAPSLFVGVPLLALAAVRTPSRRLLGAILGAVALALVAGRGGWPAWLGAPELHVAALAVVLAVHAASGVDALLAGERRALLALGAGIGCAAISLAALAALRARQPAAAPMIERALLDGGLGLVCLVLAAAIAWRIQRRGERGPDRGTVAVVVALLVLPSVGAAPSTSPKLARAVVVEAPLWTEAAHELRREYPGSPLRVFRPSFMSFLYADRETTEDALATFAGASPWRWGIGAARSADPARPRAHDATWLAASGDGGALLDRFGIELAILPSSVTIPRQLPSLGVRNQWALAAYPPAPPAAVLRGAQWAVATEDQLALLFPYDRKFPRGTVVLRGSGTALEDRGPPLPCAIHGWRSGDIELACKSDAAGYAVVSSSPAVGWRAWVDGEETPWWTADVLRRAVPLAAGDHHVRWRYVPPGLSFGFALAGIGILTALASWLWFGRRR